MAKKPNETFHKMALELRDVRNRMKVLKDRDKVLAEGLKENLPSGITDFGDCVVNISEAKFEVYRAKDLRNSLTKTEFEDLMEREIIIIKKGDFESWAKMKGYDVSALLTLDKTEDRITVK